MIDLIISGYLQRKVLLLGLVLVFLGISASPKCEALRLNPNGGYDIVIGVEDNVVEPLSTKHFLEEIRMGIDAFSAELWKATNRRFFINSVAVLVPSNWWTVNKFNTSTWETMQDSSLRITHEVSSPTVINPNPCGTSGLYIDIPDSFFKLGRGGQFGSVGKALVNLWARYRFGVWEEHGVPADTKFPYFYTRPSFEPVWEATSCSNEPLTGSFRTIDGDVSPRCDPYGTSIGDDCRFTPSPLNTANSSLLGFHWLDSNTQFCDSKTHNYVAPNRQNLFCGHHSVWDVIRQSDDYLNTTSCTETLTRPEFRVLKQSQFPEFYVLLDRGRTVTPQNVLKEVMGALVGLVSTPSIERVNIAVGTYPHENLGRDHFYVREEVGWAPMNQVIYDLQSVFERSADPTGPVIRDFGLAIQEVAEKIKERNHMPGTVLLIVKRGAGPNVFDKITHEQEVIASLKEDNRIKVFVIEAQQGDQTPFKNLESLAEATDGEYHLINDTMNTARKLQGFLGKAQEILEQSSIMTTSDKRFVKNWVTQKQYTVPNEAIEIPIYDPASVINVHLTTNRFMLASNIELDLVSGETTEIERSEKGEWDETSDLSRRHVFTFTIHNPVQGSVFSLKHGCHSEKLNECRSFLVVTAESNIPPNSGLFTSKLITIDVSTSAEHNHVDMSHQRMKIVPFAIFAKIEMERQRILALENVTALVRLAGDHDSHIGSWTVDLKDDGLGLPDVSAHDGIYSGVFNPPEDGLYQISVKAVGVSDGEAASFQDVRIVKQAGYLISRDQYNFGCRNSSKPRCVSGVPRGSFSRVVDMKSTVAVENAATFKPGKPMKILDFTVTTSPNFNVEFSFTSPKLLGSDESPDEFRIYMAPHVDNFLGSTDMTKLLINTRGEPSGTQVRIHYNAARKAIPFYAVEAFYQGQKGGPSNVVGVVPYDQGPIVPSPTTTTTTPPTTSLTTPVWPTESTTPDLPTTTDESEETDPEFTSTTEIPSSSSTIPPTTTEVVSSSTSTTTEASSSSVPTTTSPPTTSDDISSPTSTTQPPSTTTEAGSSSSVPTTTEDSVSSTSELPTTSEQPTSTGRSTTSSSTEPSVSTSTEGSTSTSTEVPTSSSTDTPSTIIPPSSTEQTSTSTLPPTTTQIITSSSTSRSTEVEEDETSRTTTTERLSTSTSGAGLFPSSPSSTSESPLSSTTEGLEALIITDLESGAIGESTSTSTEIPSTTTEEITAILVTPDDEIMSTSPDTSSTSTTTFPPEVILMAEVASLESQTEPSSSSTSTSSVTDPTILPSDPMWSSSTTTPLSSSTTEDDVTTINPTTAPPLILESSVLSSSTEQEPEITTSGPTAQTSESSEPGSTSTSETPLISDVIETILETTPKTSSESTSSTEPSHETTTTESTESSTSSTTTEAGIVASILDENLGAPPTEILSSSTTTEMMPPSSTTEPSPSSEISASSSLIPESAVSTSTTESSTSTTSSTSASAIIPLSSTEEGSISTSTIKTPSITEEATTATSLDLQAMHESSTSTSPPPITSTSESSPTSTQDSSTSTSTSTTELPVDSIPALELPTEMIPSSSTEATISSTSEIPSSSSTTPGISTTTDASSSTTTSENPAFAEAESFMGSTSENPMTSTEPLATSTSGDLVISTSTEPSATSTSENPITEPSTSSTSESPTTPAIFSSSTSSTSESPVASSTSTEPSSTSTSGSPITELSTTSTSENPVTSSSSTEPSETTSTSTSENPITTESSSSPPASSSPGTSPTTSTSTETPPDAPPAPVPEAPLSSHSTSEQTSEITNDSPPFTPDASESSSNSVTVSHTLLTILAFCSLQCQRLIT